MNTPGSLSPGRPPTSPVPVLEKFLLAPPPVTLWLAGLPIPQGRPRFARATGRAFDPDRSRRWKAACQKQLRDAMRGQGLKTLKGPINIYYEAIFEPPKSYSRKKRQLALDGNLAYTKTPDLDNLLKILLDAMNGILFDDDKQIKRICADKLYGPEEGVLVTVLECPLLGE